MFIASSEKGKFSKGDLVLFRQRGVGAEVVDQDAGQGLVRIRIASIGPRGETAIWEETVPEALLEKIDKKSGVITL